MKRVLLLSSILMLCAAGVAFAETDVKADAKATSATEATSDIFSKDESLEELLSSDKVSGPLGEFVSAKELKMPKCDEQDFRNDVIELIKNYQENNKEVTVIGKRKQALMLKRLAAFVEVKPKDVNVKKDYDLANELIKSKINLGLTDDDIRICKCTNSIDGKDLYVFMYERHNAIYGKIINFETEGLNADQLTFVEDGM